MIQPQSVTLLPGGRQQFIEPAAQTWTISPELGTMNPQTGLYHAPANVWLSRTIDVIALSGNAEIGRASVTISSARNWMTAIGLFWALLALLLIGGLFRIWPPPAAPPAVLVYPPEATLQPSDTLQFLSSVTGGGRSAVLWTAAQGQTALEGQISASGVFTAPAAGDGKPITITATRESDRTQTASAQVYLNARKLVMRQSVVDASQAPAGTKIELKAIGPAGEEKGLRWFLSGPGSLSEAGIYTVGDKSAVQAVATAVDPAGGRQAATIIRLASVQGIDDKPLLWLVAVMGAFGALLGAMRSFVNYVGNRTFVPSWGFYYFSRPIFGAGLALIVFFAYRIGAFTAPQGATPADPFAAAFIAGMVGLFADTVLQKLQELVTQLFRPADPRSDKMSGGGTAPAITALSVDKGTLTITGTNFAAGATVSLNGTGLHPTDISATKMTLAIPAALSAKGTKLDVIVINADGAKSPAMSITV